MSLQCDATNEVAILISLNVIEVEEASGKNLFLTTLNRPPSYESLERLNGVELIIGFSIYSWKY